MNIVRRLAAAIALVGILVGAPVLLWFLGRGLLPDDVPSIAQAWASLQGRDTGALFLGALVVVGFLTWLVFAICVLAEVISTVAHRPSFNLPGLRLPQAVAAGLIGLILAGTMSVSAGHTGSASASSLPPLPRSSLSQSAAFQGFSSGNPANAAAGPLVDHYAPIGAAEPAGPPGAPSTELKKASAAPQEVIWVVHKGDTLWSISEQALGDPLRFGVVADANIGRVQSDGKIFSSGDWLEIGWQVVLPGEAVVPMDRQPAPQPARAATSVIAAQGDTLWQIAHDQLGDPLRYPELAAANQIVDPNLIFVGQTILIPGSPAAPASVSDGGTNRAPSAQPVASPPGSPPIDAPSTAQVPAAVADPVRSDGQDRRVSPVAPAPAADTATSWKSAEPAEQVNDGAALMTFAGLGAVAAAALWAALAVASRRRVAGSSDETSVVVDALAAAGGDELDIAWLDLALRGLAAELAQQGRSWPDVLAAELSLEGLTLTLSAPAAAPAPFAGRGATWFLPSAADLGRSAPQIRNWPAPLPALASIGSSHTGSVLLDLERIGALQLLGDRRSRGAMLNHLAVELACSGWCDSASALLVGWGTDVVRLSPERLTHRSDLAAVVRELRVRLVETGATLTAMGVSVIDGRVRDPSVRLWAPQVVLVDADSFDAADVADLRQLMAELSQSGRTTTAIVLSGGADGEGNRVFVGPDDSAIIQGLPGLPDGARLSAVAISDHEVAGLLAIADLPAERASWLQTRTRPNAVTGQTPAPVPAQAPDAEMYWTASAGGGQ